MTSTDRPGKRLTTSTARIKISIHSGHANSSEMCDARTDGRASPSFVACDGRASTFSVSSTGLGNENDDMVEMLKDEQVGESVTNSYMICD
jgi:hypothetical protein